MIQGWARDAVEVGSLRREPSVVLCDSQLAILVRGGSAVTTHCHAATALLTREYQGDYRRQALPSAVPRAHPLGIATRRYCAGVRYAPASRSAEVRGGTTSPPPR